MKYELEEAVKALEFESCVILRPGLILGSRESGRWIEGALGGFIHLISSVGLRSVADSFSQDASIIAKAAVNAGLRSLNGEGEAKNGVWTLEQADIVRLGRKEWKD